MINLISTGILIGALIIGAVYLLVKLREEQARYVELYDKYQDTLDRALQAEGERRLKHEAFEAIKETIQVFTNKPVMAMVNEEQLMFLSKLIVKGLAEQSKSILN